MNHISNKKKIMIAIAVVIAFLFLVFIYGSPSEYKSDYEVETYKLFQSKGDFSELDTLDYTLIDVVDLGFVDGEVWLEFDLKDYPQVYRGFNLEIENPTFRKVNLYRINMEGEAVLLDKGGNEVTFSKAYFYPNPIFVISQQADFSTRFILNVRSVEPVNFQISVFSSHGFFGRFSNTLIFLSIYVGIMIALFLYNLILFFSIRDKVYVYYCFYILFIALAQLSLLGYSYHYILNQNVYLYELSIIAFSAFSGILGVFFVKEFLQTKLIVPLIDKALTFTALVYALALIMRLLSFVSFSYLLTDIGGMLVAVTFISAGFTTAMKGHRSAVFFLVAWSVFLMGLTIYILQNQRIIQLSTVPNLPMLVGSAFEAILLSLALADRINILKREKENEQREKVDALRENERLIKEQNIYLEKMVHSRTEELEQTLKNLQNTQTQLVNQEKMASLGQLTAGIAHEINNPINFVSSNISPLKRDLNDIMEVVSVYREKGKAEFSAKSKEEMKDLEEDLELDYLIEEVDQLLRGIEDGAKRTVDIVRGLRLFSRVDEQDVKRVNIHDGLDSTLILLNSSMQGEIKVVKEYGELPMIECLAGKLNQVFMNIINNAIHALLDPQYEIKDPTIHIRTIPFEEEVHIEIKDNGPGMPDHIKEKIFEPFFTTKEVGKGTGLGLSIVYTVIENHHGRLEVNSTPDEGTTFVIVLPINQNTNKNEE